MTSPTSPQPFKEIIDKGFQGGAVLSNRELLIEQGDQPKFHKPRAVPFVLKNKVEKELGRLQSLGIISPVQFANWAAPVVPVLKVL